MSNRAGSALLKVMRGWMGLTQAEMAECMGMRLRAYGDLERAVSTVKRLHLLAALDQMQAARVRLPIKYTLEYRGEALLLTGRILVPNKNGFAEGMCLIDRFLIDLDCLPILRRERRRIASWMQSAIADHGGKP